MQTLVVSSVVNASAETVFVLLADPSTQVAIDGTGSVRQPINGKCLTETARLLDRDVLRQPPPPSRLLSDQQHHLPVEGVFGISAVGRDLGSRNTIRPATGDAPAVEGKPNVVVRELNPIATGVTAACVTAVRRENCPFQENMHWAFIRDAVDAPVRHSRWGAP